MLRIIGGRSYVPLIPDGQLVALVYVFQVYMKLFALEVFWAFRFFKTPFPWYSIRAWQGFFLYNIKMIAMLTCFIIRIGGIFSWSI